MRPPIRTIIKCHLGTNNQGSKHYLGWWQRGRDEVAPFSFWSEMPACHYTPVNFMHQCIYCCYKLKIWKEEKKKGAIDCRLGLGGAVCYPLFLDNKCAFWFYPIQPVSLIANLLWRWAENKNMYTQQFLSSYKDNGFSSWSSSRAPKLSPSGDLKAFRTRDLDLETFGQFCCPDFPAKDGNCRLKRLSWQIT